MKILGAKDIKRLDEYTIEQEAIASIDLMERAAVSFVKKFKQIINPYENCIHLICGPGNNGGDGLAIARILTNAGINCFAYCTSNVGTPDYKINYKRFKKAFPSRFKSFNDFLQTELFSDQDIIIDGLFGSGLNRIIDGVYKDLVLKANKSFSRIVSIDIPSGMSCDALLQGIKIKALHTISFEVPKLAFFLAENLDFIGQFHLIPIGLDPSYYKSLASNYSVLEFEKIKSIILTRSKNAHKHSVGKALLIAGSRSMMGAAILAAKSCIRGGVGLLSCHLPRIGVQTMQISVPEVICSEDLNESIYSSPPDLNGFNGIAIGCGIGLDPMTEEAFIELLKCKPKNVPLVIDADALNILAKSNSAKELVRESNCILTPHIGEFNRLFGSSENSLDRLNKLRLASKELNATIILKGPYTAVTNPKGHIYFNSTGNEGMATAGSGDVLTGLVLAFIAQGYSNLDAALNAVYIHGLSGDLASHEIGKISLIASDLIQYLPKAIKSFE